MTSMICQKINDSDNYKCKFCYGTELDLLFKSGQKHEETYSKLAITNFLGELGAVNCDDYNNSKSDDLKKQTNQTKRTSDIKKWVAMNNDIDKIYTFGENDDEFHIIREIM